MWMCSPGWPSGWLRLWSRSCHNGSRARTSGIASKSCSGGGELVAHSRPGASQGLSEAVFGWRMVRATLMTKASTPSASTNAPIVANMFQNSQPIPSS